MPFPPGLVWFPGLATSKIPAGLACYFLRGRCLARGTLGLFRLVKTQIFEASKIGSMSENMGIETLKNAQREPPEWSNPERLRFCCKKYSTQFCATITWVHLWVMLAFNLNGIGLCCLRPFSWLGGGCVVGHPSSSLFVMTLRPHPLSTPFVITLRHIVLWYRYEFPLGFQGG